MSDKTPRVILLSHLPDEHVCAFVSNAGNRRRARRERGTVVQRSKPHMFFVSYMCFLSQLCSNLQVTQKRGGKKTHPSPHRRWRACRWGGALIPPPQHRASCSLCLALFVCISSYSSGSPHMEGRKKDSSPDGL